jgi:hypothetical protein
MKPSLCRIADRQSFLVPCNLPKAVNGFLDGLRVTDLLIVIIIIAPRTSYEYPGTHGVFIPISNQIDLRAVEILAVFTVAPTHRNYRGICMVSEEHAQKPTGNHSSRQKSEAPEDN